MIKFAILSLGILIAFSSCHRSASYQQDQSYYKDEPQSYYSNKGGKTPTQRIEALGQPKKRVVILDFWNNTPVRNAELGSFAADELKRELFVTQRMIVPPDVKSDYGTQDFIQGDTIRVAQLIREGRRLGVGVLVIGRLTKVVFRQRGDEVGLFRQKQSLAAVDVEAKVFDVATGREMMAVAKSGEASSNALVAMEGSNLESKEYRGELTKLALRSAVQLMVPEVVKSVEKMTWEGKVAKISGNHIFINAGKASGLVPGDIMKVLTQGDEIFDPASGAYLGRTPGQLKGTIEITEFIGPDGAMAELHTGGNFAEGDTVKLY